jgi:hypothetical protein
MRAGRKQIGMLLLAGISLAGVGQTTPARQFARATYHFVCYYRALEMTGMRARFWDRVALSLVLAGAEPSQSPCGKPTSS